MLVGLISTILKLWSVISRCHRLIRRSSADRYVSWSLLTEMELMWYVCALAKMRRGVASTSSSMGCRVGTRRAASPPTSPREL
uniref:Uncharacterized protein n=1 Tax=Ixodes ricinus TaxID=34613 RepID=A0A6B0TZD3_IXORI